MRLLCRHAWVLAAGLLLGCVSPTRVHELRWLEARTPHFEILSSMSPEKTVDLARDLEVFRNLVLRTVGAEGVESVVPTTIIAFGSSRAFAPFSVGGDAVGYFVSGMKGNSIVLKPYSSIGETAILKHEYVHFMLRNGEVAYPRWYDEGFAEFLATAHVEDGRVVIGMAPKWRFRRALAARDWIPLSRLMSPSPLTYSSENLYGQYWVLVHYLLLGRGGDQNVSDELHRYLVETGRGASLHDAVKAAFGLHLDELDRELKTYYVKGRFPYVSAGLEGLEEAVEPELVPVSAERMAMELGGLALRVEKPQLARSYFSSVLASSPQHARALAGMGAAEHVLENWEEADTAFQAALAADPEDALVQLDAGRHLHGLAERRWEDRGEEEVGLLVRARSHYVQSWKLDDSIPETYAMYGGSFLLDGEDPAKGVETLRHAHRLLPSNLQIRLLLARAYAGTGQPQPARELAMTVLGWTHDDGQRKAAAELLEELDAVGSETASR